jgi:hypothetical protein
LTLSVKWRSMIGDSRTPSIMMAPFNQAGPSAVSRRSRARSHWGEQVIRIATT